MGVLTMPGPPMPAIWDRIFLYRLTIMPKHLPVIHGRGSGDICADAQHFTTFALQTIDTLMREAEDEKLRFACAKYLIEQGWGRAAVRKQGEPTEDDMSPELRAKIYDFIDQLRIAKLTNQRNV